MEEIWKSIVDYEGLYEVSNWGRVRNCLTGRMLRPVKHNGGYLQVNLYKDGVHKLCLVHRLVAEAFISNPKSLPQVNHKNEVKTDNRVENLEWCPPEYNNNYGTHNERVAKAMSKTVYMYNLNDGLCGLWPSVNECMRQTGWNRSHISECCNGKLKTHKGYRWSYDAPIPPKALPYFEALPRS